MEKEFSIELNQYKQASEWLLRFLKKGKNRKLVNLITRQWLNSGPFKFRIQNENIKTEGSL